MINSLENLQIEGEIYLDKLHRIIYSTDASAYKEAPIGVIYPKKVEDIKKVIQFANEKSISLIPRTAGTSLAGQVVGNGLVVDVSKYFQKIIEINPEQKWVRVEPGVVLDELNQYCEPFGLFFAPETSTSNRCQIGGMVGNNSCGSHSLVYGSTREHLLEAKVILSDGSEALLRGLTKDELIEKQRENNLEGRIYKELISLLSQKENQKEIIDNFPERELTRRNTGYALDELLNSSYFDVESKEDFNLCKLLAGSEGTLAFITEVKLKLEPLPPKHKAVIALHCNSIQESFYANLIALEHKPVAIELIDGKILELSKENISQNKNRFFIKGDPKAILIIELIEDSEVGLVKKSEEIIQALKSNKMGYYYPTVFGEDIQKIWELRKAGLGLLSTMPGDAKPVSVVEDTAVTPKRLPEFMVDFGNMMDAYGLNCVYHAHISTGELHLRPILNLKEKKDRELFRKIAYECALLVKKHRGSLSGEHGDGRLRGEFIPILFGERVYELMREVKALWDIDDVFNKGKIINTPPMDECLRYQNIDFKIKTYFDFNKQGGFLRAIEQCNGSGDCRKSSKFSGLMCPTFRVKNEEKYSTRARANILRESLINSSNENRFCDRDVLNLLEKCISCKGCKSECPSNVDMTRLKAEYMQHYYQNKGVPFRTYIVGNIANIHKLGSVFPSLYNFVSGNKILSTLLKSSIGFASERNLPKLSKITLKSWYKHNKVNVENPKGQVYLFADEFTDKLDVEVGISFIKLLNNLGYNVDIPNHTDSGRAELSKGLLKKARKKAEKNIELLKDIISSDTPLVGIEPSSILSFRDEYLDLVNSSQQKKAKELSENILLYDEFISKEIEKGNIKPEMFSNQRAKIKLHGHCHQKSLASIKPTEIMLSLPINYEVEHIESSCCGMAGSFGYEKKHYELSLAIGEINLFPEVRKSEDYLISAPGTSCRHQIKDGTGRDVYHPIELLYMAYK